MAQVVNPNSQTVLQRWVNSGAARRWVEEHNGEWNHDDWLALLMVQLAQDPLGKEARGQLLARFGFGPGCG